MKKILLLILIISNDLNAQETEFTFTKDGLTDYVVTKCDGKTQSEIYNKCVDWIAFTYNDPQIVTKAKIENEYIRIEGISESLICDNSYLYGKICRNGKYTLEISFKDEKYKFEILKIEKFLEATTNRTGPNYPERWRSIVIKSAEPDYFINKKGKHKGEIYDTYKYYNEIALYFNELNAKLKEYIINDKKATKKDDW